MLTVFLGSSVFAKRRLSVCTETPDSGQQTNKDFPKTVPIILKNENGSLTDFGFLSLQSLKVFVLFFFSVSFFEHSSCSFTSIFVFIAVSIAAASHSSVALICIDGWSVSCNK